MFKWFESKRAKRPAAAPAGDAAAASLDDVHMDVGERASTAFVDDWQVGGACRHGKLFVVRS